MKKFGHLNLAILAVYATFVFVCILNHEIWADEAQWYLVARDSPSLLSVFAHLHHEHHPPLPYILLYMTVHFGGGLSSMQIMQGITAIAMMWAFLRLNPPKIVAILAPLGYYFLFEYGVIARPYALSIFFLFLAAYELSQRRRDWQCGLFLGFAALCTTHAMLIAIAIAPWLVILHMDNRPYRLPATRFIATLAPCVILAIVSILPEISSQEYGFLPWQKVWVLKLGLLLEDAFLTMPNLSWPQTWALKTYSTGTASGVVAFIIATTLIFGFSGLRSGTAFLSCCAVLLLFSICFAFGGPRHHGYFWILFLLLMFATPGAMARSMQNRIGRIAFIYLLVLQIPLGITTWASDIIFPFSQSKSLAQWLLKTEKKTRPETPRYAGYVGDFLNAPIAYTGGQYLELDGTGLMRIRSFDPLIERAGKIEHRCPANEGYEGLFVTTSGISSDCEGCVLQKMFGNAMFREESFQVFWCTLPPNPSSFL